MPAELSNFQDMKIGALAPWFGSKRTMAPTIIDELGPHKSYWEPFCGGMAVLLAKPPSRMETVNDLHGDIINLARVVADATMGPQLYRRARRLFTSDELLAEYDNQIRDGDFNGDVSLDRALAFFVSSWMGRNGECGLAKGERGRYLSVRWTPNGGDPATRYESAVTSIAAWRRRLRNVTILRRDAFEVIEKIADLDGTAIYIDSPYFDKSDQYLYDFEDEAVGMFASEADKPRLTHSRLAKLLRRFKRARVVVSYYQHPRLAELYRGWRMRDCSRSKNLAAQKGRTGNDAVAPEILLINQPLFHKERIMSAAGIISEASPAEAETVAVLTKPKGKKGNGGEPKTFAESFASVVENQSVVGPKGLLKQVDELKTDLNIARKREKEAMALCAAISKVRQERMLKEGEKEMVSKAIKGMEEREDRMVSELLALEMGMAQPGLPFPEVEEKKAEKKPGKDAWRKVMTATVFIDHWSGDNKSAVAVLDKLQHGLVKGRNDAANLTTLGDITDFIAKNKLTDIKGIGEKAAEKIETAMEKWWAAHPEMVEKKETKEAKSETTAAKTETTGTRSETTATRPETFLTPADLNLTAEALDELCQPHLLVSAPYDPAEKIPDLHGCVMYQNDKWVPVSVQLGQGERAYTIHRLNILADGAKCDPIEGDPYFGRLVKLDGVVMEIGSQDDAICVKVAAADAVPLAQAMGEKPRNRKGKNRKGRRGGK